MCGPFADFSIDLTQHPLEKEQGFGSFLQALMSQELIHTLFTELGIVYLIWAVALQFHAEKERRVAYAGLRVLGRASLGIAFISLCSMV